MTDTNTPTPWPRGYAAIGLNRPKIGVNVGGVLRAAFCYRASMIAIAGDRSQSARMINCTANVQRAERHIPVIRGYNLRDMIPFGCVPVAVDLVEGAIELQNYQHPTRAFYVFGPEDGTLGNSTLDWCRDRIMVPTRNCMNLAATVNVILYDRLAKSLIAKKQTHKEIRAALAKAKAVQS